MTEERSPRPTPWTILVVDDEPDIRTHLTRLLTATIPSATVLAAANGKEGLAMLAHNRVDLIISDQRMPEMDGIEFLTLAAKTAPSVPRVLLTGYAEVDVAVRAVNEGHISAFLRKPARNDDITREALRLLEAGRADSHRQVAFARGFEAARKRVEPFSGDLGKEKG